MSESRTYNTDNTLASIHSSGAAIGNLTYAWDLDNRLANIYASYINEPVLHGGVGGLRYYHRNQQYSVIALTNGGGTITKRYVYGTPTIASGSGTVQTTSADNNRYTYTGREWDSTLSLYHYRARMYDSIAGRFCSRDPIGYEGSPWLLYGYASSSPLYRFDPLGLLDVVINTSTSTETKLIPVERTLEEWLTLPKGTPLGSTEFTFSFVPKVKTKMEKRKACCPGGKDGIAYVVTEIQVDLNVNILVKIPEWVNVPRDQVQNWQQLQNAIKTHEMKHVADLKSIAAKLNGWKKNYPTNPEVIVCDQQQLDNAKKAFEAKVKAGVTKILDPLQTTFGELYQKASDDFHKTPEGAPIDPSDYLD